MQRVMCVWLPGWPLQRICLARPELKQQTILVFDELRQGKQTIVACSKRALQQGVRPGLPKAEAEAILQLAKPNGSDTPQQPPPCHSNSTDHPANRLHVEQYDPTSDRNVLRDLALWCRRYTPVVGLEESNAPDCLLFDIAGTTHLFRNERAMARRVLHDLQNLNLYVRVALADTVGTAWAVAHYGTGSQQNVRQNIPLIVPSGHERQILEALPLQALRLPANIIETLNELDLSRIRQLFDLPRSALPSRFGDILHQRIDQAIGSLPETITVVSPPRPTIERREFDFPISHRRAIEITVEQLLGRTTKTVQPQRHGILRFNISLHTESEETTEITIGLIRPSVSIPHLMRLARTRLERIQTPGDICEIRVELVASAPLEPRQETLFACRDEAKATRERELLLERISNRLGEEAVVKACPVADAQPELSFQFAPLTQSAVAAFDTGPRSENISPADRGHTSTVAAGISQRPLKLIAQPNRVDVLSTTAEGSPMTVRWNNDIHPVTHSWGPERIHTGWWRDHNVVRDYYRVETSNGQRLWLFRNGHSGHWYLHGTFD